MSFQNLTGETLGQYTFEEILGIGGMGVVYKGFQANLKRRVAIKVLSPLLAQQTGYTARFNREAETAATLEHPHIVPIYDYGIQQGITFVAMRLLTGGSLTDRILQAEETGIELPALSEVVLLLGSIASALDYAHEQGVIHRDIKPSNVMFDAQGSAYIVDFGIAKLLQSPHTPTLVGTTFGTPTFMAPEQWRGEDIGPQTDQYATAIMIYFLVAGRFPFEAQTPYSLMHKHLHDTLPPVELHRSDVPKGISLVLERALAKNADDRFPSMTHFYEAFEQMVSARPRFRTDFFATPLMTKPLPGIFQPAEAADPLVHVSAEMPDRQPVQPQTERRSLRRIILAGLLTIMIGIFGLILALRGGPSQQAAAPAQTEVVLASTSEEVNEALLLPTTEMPTPDIPTYTPTMAATDISAALALLVTPSFVPTSTLSPTAPLTNTPRPTVTSRPTATPTLISTLVQVVDPGPCTVSTDQESVAVRVGPGRDRGSFTFLPRYRNFLVIARYKPLSGVTWWEIDRTQLENGLQAKSLWVSATDVEEAGNCETVLWADNSVTVFIRPPTQPAAGQTTSNQQPQTGPLVPQPLSADQPPAQSQPVNGSSYPLSALPPSVTPLPTLTNTPVDTETPTDTPPVETCYAVSVSGSDGTVTTDPAPNCSDGSGRWLAGTTLTVIGQGGAAGCCSTISGCGLDPAPQAVDRASFAVTGDCSVSLTFYTFP